MYVGRAIYPCMVLFSYRGARAIALSHQRRFFATVYFVDAFKGKFITLKLLIQCNTIEASPALQSFQSIALCIVLESAIYAVLRSDINIDDTRCIVCSIVT